jgi:hypothetical protein
VEIEQFNSIPRVLVIFILVLRISIFTATVNDDSNNAIGVLRNHLES